jgi:hypothetical protein
LLSWWYPQHKGRILRILRVSLEYPALVGGVAISQAFLGCFLSFLSFSTLEYLEYPFLDILQHIGSQIYKDPRFPGTWDPILRYSDTQDSTTSSPAPISS